MIEFRIIVLLTCLLLPMPAISAAVTYQYDDLGRLTRINYGAEASVTYTYDKSGNLTTRSIQSDQTPTVVSGINATDGQFTGRVRVTWNSFPEATVYRVYRCTTNQANSCGSPIGFPSNTVFDDRKGVSGKVYSYRVKACTPQKCNGFSADNTGYRGALQLSAPATTNASDGQFADRVRLSWKAVLGATVYRVFRCTTNSAGSCGSPVGFLQGLTFDDRKGVKGKVYSYRVKACAPGKCSAFGPQNTGYRGAISLSPPTGISATDGSFADRVRVSWNGVLGAKVYRVFRCTTQVTNSCGPAIGFPKSAPFDDSNGEPNRVYYYRVKACSPIVCSGFSVVNAGNRGNAPGIRNDLDAGTEADAASVPEAISIPVRGRWLLILMSLGFGLLMLHRRDRQMRSNSVCPPSYHASATSQAEKTG